MEMARPSPFVFVHSWQAARHEEGSGVDTVGCKDSSANRLRPERGLANASSPATAKWQSAALRAIVATMIFSDHSRLWFHLAVPKAGATMQLRSALGCQKSLSKSIATISSEAGGEAENRRKDEAVACNTKRDVTDSGRSSDTRHVLGDIGLFCVTLVLFMLNYRLTWYLRTDHGK